MPEISDLNEFQAWCSSKASAAYKGLPVCALAIAGEAGEVADIVKKVVAQGKAYDAYELTLELGDVLWGVAVMADTMGVSLTEVVEALQAKLNRRYPNGNAAGNMGSR